ncbi:MAG TPA: xanthine dehydrogenase family protein molybdopterin-binding subunit [Geminicoccaceae bacterium]|nr:xanthine dehydrogenase family protein molybdopterin-binding subunit [Geminicoccaceae bacterium]
MSWIGRPIPRLEDPALLTGQGRFVADTAQGAAAVRFVRSPVARGRILGIDVPNDLPAGVRVITAADLADVRPIRPLLHRPDYVAIGQPALAATCVRHVGEPVAAVVAPGAAQAEDVAELVFVEIEPEEAVADLDLALAAGAPQVHAEAPGNLLIDGRLATEGFDAAVAAAAHLVEIEVCSRRQSAMPLEARAAHASFERATGRVTLTCSVQMPHMLRTAIADHLGMRESDLRVVAPDVGGAFGQKMSLFPEYLVLVWLARRLRGAVAWIEDRRENLTASAHGRDQRHRVRGAFAADGRLLALEGDLRCNVGAYSSYPVTCGVEPLMALAELPGPYDVRHYRARARGVATNTCMMAPYRGVSRPVITLAMERLMDCAADRLGLDPVELRRRNLVRAFPYRSATGLLFDEGSYLDCLERAAATVDLPAFRARQAAARAAGRFLGVGFCVFSERTGYGTPAFAARGMEIAPGYERVEIAMDPSGNLEARIGASPHGQGLATTLAQLIADELGVEPAQIRIAHGDTDRTPYGWGTFASRSLVIAGGACKLAAAALRDRLARLAGHLLEADPGDVEFADGRARVRGTDLSIELATLARQAYHQSHRFGDAHDPYLAAHATYDPAGTFSNATHAAIVEVDPETGHVAIERFLVVEDAGVLINPMIADGQVHGGVAQGIAHALFEEIVYDDEGNILTASLADYLPPTCAEIPPIEVQHLVTESDATLTRAKGLGEGGAIGAPAAVLNAIADALKPFGVGVFEMPATPQRLRALIRTAQAGEVP